MKYVMPSFLKDFKCLEEGYCCHRWNISVTPKELDSILANLQKIPKENRPADCGFDIIRDEQNKITNVYTKNINDTCSFLVGKKCFLHMHFGMRGKPSICQSYPFYAIKTPDITYINMSMACPCGSLMLINNNEYKLVNPTKFVGNEFSLKADLATQKFVRLSENCSINWKSFYFLQKKLLLSHKEKSVLDCAIKIFRGEKRENLTVEQVHEIWEEIKNSSPKKPSNQYLKNVIIAWSIWHSNNKDDGEISPAISYFLDFLGIVDMNNISEKSQQSYLEIYHECIENKELQKILHNYLFILLFGSDFYFSYSFVDAICLIGFAVELAIFFTLATSSHSSEGITKEHLLDGIFAIEKFFFHSDYFTDLNNAKEKIPGFSNIFRAFAT